jgi:uncharacterized protein (TIGR03067 family)
MEAVVRSKALLKSISSASFWIAVAGCGDKNPPGNTDSQSGSPKTALPTPGSSGTIPPGPATNVPPVPSRVAPSNSSGLDGVYQLTELYFLGQWMPGNELKSSSEEEIKFVIKGDTINSGLFNKLDVQKFRTDPSRVPAEIDILDFDELGRENTGYGIYKLERDTLTIAIGVVDSNGVKVRPKDFTVRPEVNIMILKRKT